MRITVISVGKLKEKYWKEALQEYSKRLSKYCKLDIVEVQDEKAPETMTKAEQQQVCHKEGQRILKVVKENAFVIALAIEGRMFSSEQFAEQIQKNAVQGVSHVIFIIGGSLGLSKEVMQRADRAISFSAMTFPHQMMRVILLEQIYRAMRIINGEPYHK